MAKKWGGTMETVVSYFVDTYGYLGLVFLVEISPVSSDIVLVFSGFMTSYSNLEPHLIVLAITVSSTIVGTTLYLIGRIFDIEKIMRMLHKWEKYSPIKEKNVIKIREWFNERGAVVVFVCRLIPGLRSVVSLPAGMIRMKFIPFFLLTVSGTAVWAILCVYVGVLTGDNWWIVETYLNTYGIVMVIILALIIWFSVKRMKKRKNSEKE